MIGGGPVFSKQWINVVCKIFNTYFTVNSMPGLANKGNILVALNILKLLSGALFSYVTTVKSEEGVLYPQLLLLFNHSVISDSMQPYGLQHARLPCPSLSSWSGSHSCPLSQ